MPCRAPCSASSRLRRSRVPDAPPRPEDPAMSALGLRRARLYFLGLAAWLMGLGLPGLRAELVQPTIPAIEETLDRRYHDADPRQVLDVFRPRGADHRPVVLFVHGGAW